ncbi:MAG: 16S rRNA (cytosine(1402)-N(4))-methyltransferase RsmH [Candidatus Nanopelagicaceae bacterium]|nr:16S rRNA (cytosine(1402)-N(4))-methyltransferase RsmH [Candidatus Nanopelagicaceae bacterium]
MQIEHTSVLLERCITLLAPSIQKSKSPIVVDATLGLGGHSLALLEKFPQLRIVGLDRDKTAISKANQRLAPFSDRIKVIHAVYDEMPKVLDSLGISDVDGILFDLGVSSMQLDNSERGFSYSQSAPLDMRMDQSQGLSAQEVLESYSRNDLIRVIREYGEERFASRIVDNIIAARESGKLHSTTDLAEIVKQSIPAPARRVGGNPAKRTFQALRIEVNQELAVLERAIPRAMDRLNVGGRLVVMSFQSLEDKIVKRYFSAATESMTPIGLPVEIASLAAKFQLVFRGSEKASEEEINKNSRAQSVRLRAIERVAS